MKVLHVNFLSGVGGAFVAARKLSSAASSLGYSTEELYILRASGNWNPDLPKSLKFRIRVNRFVNRYFLKIIFGKDCDIALFKTGLGKFINPFKFDVIHLHWIAGGLISPRDLKDIDGRVVISVHDMWPLSGISHWTLSSKNKLEMLYSSYFLEECKKANVLFCFTTQWIINQVKVKKNFSNVEFCRLFIPLDDYFKPVQCGETNLSDTFRIGIGAVGIEHDQNKGLDFVRLALKSLPPDMRQKIRLDIFGTEFVGTYDELGVEICMHGSLGSKQELLTFYNNVDLQLLPSTVEMFGQTACEALQCGTPVLVSDNCGISDYVVEGFNGFTFNNNDVENFKNKLLLAFNKRQFSRDAISSDIYNRINMKTVQQQLNRAYNA